MGLDDAVYEANRTLIIRIFCESRFRDEEMYRMNGEILRGELNIVLLPGIETLGLEVSSTETPKEAMLLSKGITSLYRVISSLSSHHVQETAINWKNSKVLQYLHHAVLPSSFTCLVSLLYPTVSHESISYSTLLFAHRMRKILQNPTPCRSMNKGVVVKYLKDKLKSLEEALEEKDVGFMSFVDT